MLTKGHGLKAKRKKDKPVAVPVQVFKPKTATARVAEVDLIAREERRAIQHLRSIMAG